MALSQDVMVREFYQGMRPLQHQRPSAGTMAITLLYLGALAMQVDGVAQPVVSGTAMKALALKAPGADVNGDVYVSSREANVRLTLLGGTSKTLDVSVTYTGVYTDVLVQLGTDGGAAVTTTGAGLAQAIRKHAEADRLLRVLSNGTGASIQAVLAATAVPCITLLGVNDCRRLDNAAGAAALQLPPVIAFKIGTWGMQPGAVPPTALGSPGYLVDDNTVSATVDPLALRAPLFAADSGLLFMDLERCV